MEGPFEKNLFHGMLVAIPPARHLSQLSISSKFLSVVNLHLILSLGDVRSSLRPFARITGL